MQRLYSNYGPYVLQYFHTAKETRKKTTQFSILKCVCCGSTLKLQGIVILQFPLVFIISKGSTLYVQVRECLGMTCSFSILIISASILQNTYFGPQGSPNSSFSEICFLNWREKPQRSRIRLK